MMTHSIRLLGTFEVEVGGQLAPIMTSPKGMALLAYLIVRQKAQPREVIAELLWESASRADALNSLRTLLSRIRPWLPELQVTRQTIAFEPQEDTWVDFSCLHYELINDDMVQLDEVLYLYRGELLENFYLPDAPRFNEWCLLEREHVHQRVLTAHRRLNGLL